MDKKRKLKLIISIVIWLVAILLIAYVIAAYVRMNDDHISLEEYYGASFYGQDGECKIEFNADATYAHITTTEGGGDYTIEYSYNVFTLTGTEDKEDVRRYIIVDRDFIFGDNQYYIFDRGEQ